MPRLKALIILLAASAAAMAQTTLSSDSAATATDIVSHITASGRNTVTQPAALAAMLLPAPANAAGPAATEETAAAEEPAEKPAVQTGATKTRMAGFRVQVFSDNNPGTAKNEARSKKRILDEHFPQHRTYITFTSPYWRLRVGDFRSRSEAEAAADDIRRAFPAYAKELRVVNDRINVTN